MKIVDNTEEIHTKYDFKVGDLLRAQDGHVFMIASDPDYKYYLVSLGDGSMSDACDSIGELLEEGYLDETDKKVSGFLTIESERD